MEKRPDFGTLASYEEFKKYYWYRKELSGICRKLGIEYRGTKQELNHHIAEYFCGKLAERKGVPRLSKKVSDIELHTPLLDCGFSFNAFFREYFAKQTGTRPFKFTADMAAAWRTNVGCSNWKDTICAGLRSPKRGMDDETVFLVQ